MYRFLGRSVLIAAVAALMGVSALAQQKGGTLTCRDNVLTGLHVGCEMEPHATYTLPY